MQSLLVVFVCCACLFVASTASSFEEFKAKYGKAYENEIEEQHRKQIFEENLKFIQNFKSDDFKVAMNEFGDLTSKEFAAKFMSKNNMINTQKSLKDLTRSVATNNNVVVGDIPATKDWRTTGCISPPIDQGQCGAVWSFVSRELIQDMWCIEHGKTVALSTQNLIDCVSGNEGCNGGTIGPAFQYCLTNGIDSEASYPYTGQQGPCKAKAGTYAAKCKYFKQVPSGNETALLQVLGTIGPVACAIEADQSSFQFYTSGIFTGPCGRQLDHMVLNVGYGTQTGVDYYILENSWGASWGMHGYMYLQRGKELCGIADAAYYLQVI